MGKLKQSLIDQVIAAPAWKVKQKCKRRKYKTEQTAINSSYALARSGRLTTTPEYCNECGAWHMRFKP